MRAQSARSFALTVTLSLVLVSCAESVAPTTETAPTATSSTPVENAPTSTPSSSTVDTSTSTSEPTSTTLSTATPPSELELVAYPVPRGSRPHDVAPAADGGVWYTAQGSGELGWLDPETGDTRHTNLGSGSRPHGVIVDSAGFAWVTDGGRNSIQKIDPSGTEVTEYPLPTDRPDANLNTAVFDPAGRLWFTGQNGIVGTLDSLDSTNARMRVFDAPRGRGPYGITTTPDGEVYFASLAGSYVGQISEDGSITVLEPPTENQGARRVWSDSGGSVWVSEWNSGQLSRYDPVERHWSTWALPGPNPRAYAVFVDSSDIVWVSDFGGNAIHRFDPADEGFFTFELPSNPGEVRQIHGRPGEVWGAESAADQLVVIRAAP